MQANALRAGMCVLHNNEVCSIMSVTHRTPGNLRAFVQVRMRNLKNGNSFEHRFASTESVERAILDTIPMEYLYSDGDMHHFMSQENYEQVTMSNDVLGDTLQYMLPNSVIKVDFYEGTPVGIELPNVVVLEVVDTEPGNEGRDRFLVLQARQDGNRPHRPGASLHRVRHQDRDRHPREQVPAKGLRRTPGSLRSRERATRGSTGSPVRFSPSLGPQ